jgi:hypothetical protein
MSDAAPFLVQHVCGRLVLTRPSKLRSAADVTAFGRAMKESVSSIAGSIVICGDYRETAVLTQPAADAFLGMLATFNPRIDRSAVLLASEHATFSLQIERLVREAGSPSRRTFRAASELIAWLGEVLSQAERARLVEILGTDPRVAKG